MINQKNFDVITVSETYLLEYVRLPGYEFAYRNREEKRGGSVRVYLYQRYSRIQGTYK